MALYNFTACTNSNNIGNIIVSADTSVIPPASVPPITIYNQNFSGMCYTWDGTTATGAPDLTLTSASQYDTRVCSTVCRDDFSIRISGCTGQGTWILGNTSPSLTYSVGDSIHLSSSTLNGCFEVIDDGYATQSYLLDLGDDITGPYVGCSGCTSDYCNYQDVMILLDESGSISYSEWEYMISGTTNIVNGLKLSMDSNATQVGIMRWSTCNQINTLVGLTSDYDTVYNALTGATKLYSGGTQPSKAISVAYSALTGSSVTEAEKNIVLITDGVLTDFEDDQCSIGYSTTQICNNIKAGTYSNGQVMKILTVGIGIGANSDELAALSSGSEFSFEASDFEVFRDVTSLLIPDLTCEDTPDPGTIDVWLGVDCCGINNDILIGINDQVPITPSTDAVVFNGNCYYFDSLSAGTIDYLALSGDVVTCSYSGCPTCPTPTPTPTSSNTPTPTETPNPTPTSTPTPTGSQSCYVGTTNGVFQYVDCCGVVRNGNNVGQTICVNPLYSYSGILLSTTECSTECNQGDLLYSFIVSGTCLNSNGGRINIFPSGGVKPYTIQNNNPGTLPTLTTYDSFIYTGLTAGTYTFTINDSSGGVNQTINVNINLEGCLSLSASTTNGTCGNNNGSLRITGDSYSFPYNYKIYRNSGLISSGLTSSNPITINNLNSGNYYAVVTDYGGSSAQTETYTITSGTAVNFGFTVTGSSVCNNNVGAATLTGITGVPPFTYLWNDGQTGTTATGLTYGIKSVIVTDSNGCSTTKQVNIPQIESLGVASLTTTQASCFNENGTATVTITGGTSPFLYSADTGYVSSYITNRTFTFTGLTGNHTIRILDSNFCDIESSFNVSSTAGFNSVSVTTVDSACGEDGSINISVQGIVTQQTYSITGSTGNTQTFTTTQQNHTFINLPTDTYTVGVSSGSGCDYVTTATINNVNKFFVETQTTGTTCGGVNGIVNVNVTSGSTRLQLPLDYIIRRVDTNQVVSQNIDSPLSTETVNNLASGTYKLEVTDFNSCTITKYFTINSSLGINASVQKTDCLISPNTGNATLNIYGGAPPFTITWSDNVNGQEGYTVNNLSGGTYTASVTDTNGCSTSVRFDIICNNRRSVGYNLYNVCEQDMITTVGNKRSFYSMLNEAFLDTSNGNLNCVLDTAIFTLNFTLTSSTVSYSFSEDFYTGTTLTDVPSDNLWVTTLDNILSQITELKSYTIDLLNNKYILVSDCVGDEDPLKGAYVKLELFINMDIDCVTNRSLLNCSLDLEAFLSS